jgi:hypothetical protein
MTPVRFMRCGSTGDNAAGSEKKLLTGPRRVQMQARTAGLRGGERRLLSCLKLNWQYEITSLTQAENRTGLIALCKCVSNDRSEIGATTRDPITGRY